MTYEGISPIRHALVTMAQLGASPPPAFAAAQIRIRLAGRPYLAQPHLDGRPGYALTPDRAQRFADRQETMTP